MAREFRKWMSYWFNERLCQKQRWSLTEEERIHYRPPASRHMSTYAHIHHTQREHLRYHYCGHRGEWDIYIYALRRAELIELNWGTWNEFHCRFPSTHTVPVAVPLITSRWQATHTSSNRRQGRYHQVPISQMRNYCSHRSMSCCSREAVGNSGVSFCCVLIKMHQRPKVYPCP